MRDALPILWGYAWVLLTVAFAILGDYFLKRAADFGHSILSVDFSLGAALYVASTAVWFLSLKNITLAQAGVAYASITLVAVCGLSAIVFHEPFGFREGVGVALALLAMGLMIPAGGYN
ncbi:hypothetical protein So717_01320 [Roseobacter cerasinus]|uniref:EamA domain-containing protein n=1 Tax=Roseobacter cerasinus TaxID=2602289 RepID=A0A640VJX9_9RHOB|nr:hypothetical protein [Roseobacter cerasinus]GFE48379.1 hypothetical protein So717_01320 [Roseobacter cerasinus]